MEKRNFIFKDFVTALHACILSTSVNAEKIFGSIVDFLIKNEAVQKLIFVRSALSSELLKLAIINKKFYVLKC